MKPDSCPPYSFCSSGEGRFESRTPEHNFAISAGPGGVRLTHPAGSLAVRFSGVGRGGAIRPQPVIRIEGAGCRLKLERGAVVEWYENGPRGLEQGFLLHRPPAGRSRGPLELALRIDSGLQTQWTGDILRFGPPDGPPVLEYKELRAWDRDYSPLPARLSWRNETAVIAIDDSRARYPITIDPIFSQSSRLSASDPAEVAWFGRSVAMSGGTIAVGAPLDDANGIDSGSVYIFARGSSGWVQQAKLVPSDGAMGDGFGAAVSLSGDRLLVGSFLDDDRGADSGSAYVFIRNNGVWTQEAKLTASDGKQDGLFGYSVSLLGDQAVIGATEGSDAAAGPGSAYVFRRSGPVWTQTAKLVAGDAAAGDQFGAAVAQSDTAILAGAPSKGGKGAAYAFVWSGGVPTQQAKLTASDQVANGFGAALAIYDGTLWVGAPFDDARGEDAGAVYVFRRTGGNWTQQEKIIPADAAPGDQFGRAVSIAGDVALAGAPGADSTGLADAGALYSFLYDGVSWRQDARLTASSPGRGFGFGMSSAIGMLSAVAGSYYAGPLTGQGAAEPMQTAAPVVAFFRDTSRGVRASLDGSSSLLNQQGQFASGIEAAVASDGEAFFAGRDLYDGVWLNSVKPRAGGIQTAQYLPGTFMGQPRVAVTGAGTVIVTARDVANSLWLASFRRTDAINTVLADSRSGRPGWNCLAWFAPCSAPGIGWRNLGGAFETDPALTACPDGSVYLIGRDAVDGLWSGRYVPATETFEGWKPGRGGPVKGIPSATCGQDNAVYVAFRDNLDSVWMGRVVRSTWSGPFLGGGAASSDPQIAASEGKVWVVVLGANGAVSYQAFAEGETNSWQGWKATGGTLATVTAAAAAGELNLIGRAANGDLYWWRQNQGAWINLGNQNVTTGTIFAAPR